MQVIDGIQPRRFSDTPEWWLLALPQKPSRWRLLVRFFAAALLLIGVIFTLKPVGAAVDLTQLIRDGRYLVVFQNNTELRPSGGFLGSFAVIDIQNHRLKNYWFETNPYKTEKEFKKQFFVPPPEPLAESWPGESWAFTSSNWPIDFFESASSMKWFYESEYQDKIDGVVAVNATVMVKLLDLIGPVQLLNENLTVTSDNFLKEVQYKVEKEYFETAENLVINEPKTILKDLMAAILARLQSNFDPQKLWDLISSSLDEKDVQLAFFSNPDQQLIAERRNWAGRIVPTPVNGHYLSINNANLHGGKGSLGVKQQIRYNYQTTESGETLVELAITRQNLGRQDGWAVPENRNFTRVLVPFGSKLIEARLDDQPIEDVKIDLEAQKTVFGFWFTTQVDQSRIAVLSYRLPRTSRDPSPHLIYQKQSGSPPDDVEVHDQGTLIYHGIVDQDLIIQ